MNDQLTPNQLVLVRDHKDGIWLPALFHSYNNAGVLDYKYCVQRTSDPSGLGLCPEGIRGESFIYCIDFEQNKELVGTNYSPPEPGFWYAVKGGNDCIRILYLDYNFRWYTYGPTSDNINSPTTEFYEFGEYKILKKLNI